MRKFLLIASVAAIAVTAPAQAEREGRGQRGERAQQQRRTRAAPSGAPTASSRPLSRARSGRRRPSGAPDRQQDFSNRRAIQQQAQPERRGRLEQAQPDRRRQRSEEFEIDAPPAANGAVRSPRAHGAGAIGPPRPASAGRFRTAARAWSRCSRIAASRASKSQSDRRSRFEQAQSDRRARMRSEVRFYRRAQGQQFAVRSPLTLRPGASHRRSRFQQIELDRRSAIQRRSRTAARACSFADERRAFAGDDNQWRQRLWERRAERENALAQLRDRRLARWAQANDDRRDRDNFFRIGQRVDRNWWYDDYVPFRYRSSFYDDDRYYYRTTATICTG